LCQPWIRLFHVYGFLIIIFGLVGFIFFSHIKPLPAEETED
jgi:hypothetical protein